MNKLEFKKLMDDLCLYYRREKMTAPELRIYYDGLISLDIELVKTAIAEHVRCTDQGQFFPLAASLNRRMNFKHMLTDTSWATQKNQGH